MTPEYHSTEPFGPVARWMVNLYQFTGFVIAALLTGQEISMNYVRTAVLLAALTALLMGIGYLLGGRGGALIAFFVAAATNFFAYWNGDRLVLSMHGDQEVD